MDDVGDLFDTIFDDAKEGLNTFIEDLLDWPRPVVPVSKSRQYQYFEYNVRTCTSIIFIFKVEFL